MMPRLFNGVKRIIKGAAGGFHNFSFGYFPYVTANRGRLTQGSPDSIQNTVIHLC